MRRAPTRLALALIRAYQAGISPGLGTRCRFEPTCSKYAYEAISRYGVLRGMRMAAGRLIRCRPGKAGGYDPVSGEQTHATESVEPIGSGSAHVA